MWHDQKRSKGLEKCRFLPTLLLHSVVDRCCNACGWAIRSGVLKNQDHNSQEQFAFCSTGAYKREEYRRKNREDAESFTK